jgi:uncharacterized protein (DUF3820 family)
VLELNDDQEELIKLVNMEMPFGKYKGYLLIELPEPYLVWFHGEGFPHGKLGERLALMYEIKRNGLEKMLKPLIQRQSDKALSPQTTNRS